MRALVHHKGTRHGRQRTQALQLGLVPAREEPLEEEVLHGKPRGHERTGDGTRTGDDLHAQARIERGIHQALSRIGDARHARVGHEGHALPGRDAPERGRDAGGQGVLVRTLQRHANAKVGQQP